VITAMPTMRGMTLVELMIVLVIVSILAAVAYPNYTQYVNRAKRNEAKAALLKAQTNQERYFLQNSEFSTDLTQLGFSTNPYTTDTGSYVISVAAPIPAADFTVTATYQLTGSEAEKCSEFTVDSRGVKASSPAPDCWTRTR